ncbi:MAG: class I SAM-dependent methyltransferase [Puniceicoccaceae bacterium]|nr:MAG: class I SAM-dependent methyltransferase [Puniceicoccaceae bacterium]
MGGNINLKLFCPLKTITSNPVPRKGRLIQRLVEDVLGQNRIMAPKGVRILDVGCGDGAKVGFLRSLGYEAFGCDVSFKVSPRLEEMVANGWLFQLELEDYQFPFPDRFFDCLYSDQVVEHVQNFDQFIPETARVLKADGHSFHYFPSRFRFMEAHVKLPYAALIRVRPWLLFWILTLTPVRKWKADQLVKEVDLTASYLNNYTNYLPFKTLLTLFSRSFGHVSYDQRKLLSAMDSKIPRWLRLSPVFVSWYSLARARLLLARKPCSR